MINNVTLTGRLSRDPEILVSKGHKICNFTLAVNDGYGEKQKANFFKCQAWNRQAEILGKYTKKGDLIGIVGKLIQNRYEDSNGRNVISTEILCLQIIFLSTKSNSNSNAQYREYEEMVETPTYIPKQEENRPIYDIPDEDDLPF